MSSTMYSRWIEFWVCFAEEWSTGAVVVAAVLYLRLVHRRQACASDINRAAISFLPLISFMHLRSASVFQWCESACMRVCMHPWV